MKKTALLGMAVLTLLLPQALFASSASDDHTQESGPYYTSSAFETTADNCRDCEREVRAIRLDRIKEVRSHYLERLHALRDEYNEEIRQLKEEFKSNSCSSASCSCSSSCGMSLEEARELRREYTLAKNEAFDRFRAARKEEFNAKIAAEREINNDAREAFRICRELSI